MNHRGEHGGRAGAFRGATGVRGINDKADGEPSALNGGDEGDRTLDLGIANAALSQLSYVPG